ncbi:MAG: stage II sporulation protein E, partial [Chloroflexi bacterium]
DGITEAMNSSGELFGDERLHHVLQAHATQTANDLVTTVVAAVDAFAAGAPQADDITLLVVERLPAEQA